MSSNVRPINNSRPVPNLSDPEIGAYVYDDDEDLKRPNLKEVPIGYPFVASWLDADEYLAIFRRFGTLKARVLLTQQADIEALERRLRDIDRNEDELSDTKHGVLSNTTWIDDRNKERKKLIKEIGNRLRCYERDLLLYRQMLELPKAQKKQKENYRIMLRNNRPLCKSERQFLGDLDDLVAINHEQEDTIELLESILDKLGMTKLMELFSRVFFKRKLPAPLEGQTDTTATSQSSLNNIGKFFFGIIVSIIILVGVIVLYRVKSDNNRLIVLCCATLVCAILTSLFTKAKKSEVFAVVAAYCAVLVVFVGGAINKDSSTIKLQFGNLTINGTVSN